MAIMDKGCSQNRKRVIHIENQTRSMRVCGKKLKWKSCKTFPGKPLPFVLTDYRYAWTRHRIPVEHTHTTVLLLFWNMSGTTRVSRYQKGKTRSPAVAGMADRTAPVVKLTLTLILPGAQEWDGVSAHATVAKRAIIWQKQAVSP